VSATNRGGSVGAVGSRNVLMTFEAPVVSADEYGGQVVQVWQPVASAWCEMKTLSAFERLRALRLQVLATHEIVAGWCMELAAVDTTYRVNVTSQIDPQKTRIMNILSVINTDEQNEELVMLAEEGAPT